MGRAEDEIGRLPHGAPSSWRVVMEWIKENRNAAERRADAQDRQISALLPVVMGKLDEIHAETRRTNGRVTALEKRADLDEALSDERHDWDQQLADDEDAEAEQRARRRRNVINGALVIIGAVGGGAAQPAGHGLGLW